MYNCISYDFLNNLFCGHVNFPWVYSKNLLKLCGNTSIFYVHYKRCITQLKCVLMYSRTWSGGGTVCSRRCRQNFCRSGTPARTRPVKTPTTLLLSISNASPFFSFISALYNFILTHKYLFVLKPIFIALKLIRHSNILYSIHTDKNLIIINSIWECIP